MPPVDVNVHSILGGQPGALSAVVGVPPHLRLVGARPPPHRAQCNVCAARRKDQCCVPLAVALPLFTCAHPVCPGVPMPLRHLVCTCPGHSARRHVASTTACSRSCARLGVVPSHGRVQRRGAFLLVGEGNRNVGTRSVSDFFIRAGPRAGECPVCGACCCTATGFGLTLHTSRLLDAALQLLSRATPVCSLVISRCP